MKKLIPLFALMLAAQASFGLSLQWAATGVSYGGNKLVSAGSELSSYLIYLSTGSFASSYTIDDKFKVADLGTIAGTGSGTTKAGKNSTTTDYGTTYSNGDVFGMLLVYTDASSSKTYYNLSSSTYTMKGAVEAPPTDPDAATFTFSYDNGTNGTLSAGGGWVAAAAVPEPATGALALAGIALLLKRRKAAKA